jgi:hypothetical protein
MTKIDFDDANSTDPSKHMAPPFDLSDLEGMISDFTGGKSFGVPGEAADGAAATDDA